MVHTKGSRIRRKLIDAHHRPDRQISGCSLIDPIQTIVDVFKVDKFRPHVGNIDHPMAGELDELVDVLLIAAMTAGEFDGSDHQIDVRDGERFGIIADKGNPAAGLQ